jgi:hypothetical protein
LTDVSLPPVPQPDLTPSQSAAPPTPHELEMTAPIPATAVQSGDQCPSCGTALAADQRYCLDCGQRRGDPRLPFMDAVVLMDAVKQPRQAPPPPAKRKRTGISPNAALIAGVGTLLLALGIGVLIGRSGHQEVAQTSAAPIVIHSGGGSEAEATPSKSKATTGGGAANAKTKKQKAAAEKAAEAHPAAEEIIKPASGVKLAPPTVKPGDKCESGAAGCENGEFTGNFFGE